MLFEQVKTVEKGGRALGEAEELKPVLVSSMRRVSMVSGLEATLAYDFGAAADAWSSQRRSR